MIHTIEKIRELKPLIHTITNAVVINFTANGLLAIGASPFMSHALEEVADTAKMAGAVSLNMGTLDEQLSKSLISAGQSANQHQVPVVFDPVGAGATPYRTKIAKHILQAVQVTVLRGNAAEVANLLGEAWSIKGVDAIEGEGNVVSLAEKAARAFRCITVITGKEDVVSDGKTTYLIDNGHPIMTSVTGTGCLLGAVIAAFLAVTDDKKDHLSATAEAVAFYGVAGEEAAGKTAIQGPGSFQIEFLNQLARVSVDLFKQRSSIQAVTATITHTDGERSWADASR